MKVSIHTDILVELAESVGLTSELGGLAEDLLSARDLECWTPALCVAKAYETVQQEHGQEVANRLLEFVNENVGSVPLRSTAFTDLLQSGFDSLEAAGHKSVDTLIDIDAILSRSLDVTINNVRCVTPEQCLASKIPSDDSTVPFLDLKMQYSKVYNEIDNRFTDILANTAFVLGKHVEEFEKSFADAQGAKYCVGVSSGTDALHLAFMALSIGPGDEVIVPVNTFIATAEAVSLAGAKPIFVDSNEYYNIDVQATRRVLEERRGSHRIRAIAPVHLYGQPADLGGLLELAEEHDLRVVEDCAQAHMAEFRGASVGNMGDYGAFSFYPGKNLGAFGEAGALITNDVELYECAKMLRAHGESVRYHHSAVGHNYRMEAFQGAVLATKVKHIADWSEARRRNADLYRELLADTPGIELPRDPGFAKSVYHLFIVQVDDRDDLRDFLAERSIATGLHYPLPLHLQKAYADMGYKIGDFPVAESQAERIVSLPMYPELSPAQIERVCSGIKQFLANR